VRWSWLSLLFGVSLTAPSLQAAEVSLRLLTPQSPSSFPVLAVVQVTNDTFVPMDLAAAFAKAQWIVDGRPITAAIDRFEGPPGLAAQASWSGCLVIPSSAAIAPGKHRFQLRLGDAESHSLTERWPKFEMPATTPADRLRQVKSLLPRLTPRLSRRCVEAWFPVLDGGLQPGESVRYYVAPDVKVVVPYAPPGRGRTDPEINGRPRLYTEARIAD
jgi:hypothetical protein